MDIIYVQSGAGDAFVLHESEQSVQQQEEAPNPVVVASAISCLSESADLVKKVAQSMRSTPFIQFFAESYFFFRGPGGRKGKSVELSECRLFYFWKSHEAGGLESCAVSCVIISM